MATMDLMNRALAAVADSEEPLTVEVVHGLIEPGELTEPLGISDVAELLDISAHTLRYYERCGLIEVARDGLDHRSYDDAAVRRLVFLTRMRLSGMAMRDLHHYVELVDGGEATVAERLDMLVEHRDTVRRRIRELQLSLVATEYKIATYGGATGP
ncbi:MAG: MerR family transcriptional regulator [Rhodococcus sp. (in: high G+C Gram-positive bacteria)]